MSKSRWIVMLTLGVALAACGDSMSPEEGELPVLPAEESMLFDFDFFDGSGAPAAVERQVTPGLHWAAAAFSVGIANIAVVLHTAIPLATWRAAAVQVPVFEDGRWHWRFSVTEGGQTYASDLSGFIGDGDRVFEMSITSTQLGLTDFVWYTGRAPVGGTTGEWSFFDPQSPSTAVASIVWTHPDADAWTLTFNALSGANSGDELMYGVDGNAREVMFLDASEDETVVVEWDAATHVGSFTGPNYNGGEPACWDAMLANTPCS